MHVAIHESRGNQLSYGRYASVDVPFKRVSDMDYAIFFENHQAITEKFMSTGTMPDYPTALY
jgi:hypothetical protein